MSTRATTTAEITFDHVLDLAQQLRPIDQARLVARLAPKMESLLDQVEPMTIPQPRQALRGLLANLGPAPSAEEIDEAQHEMWATFGQE